MKHLVVRAPNWVGDLVMATPILEAALASTDWERVTILVRQHLLGVLADGPWEGHVEGFQGKQEERAALKRLAPDALLLLTNSFGAAWRARRAGVPIIAGAALSSRRFLLTHSCVPPTRDGRREPIPTAHLLRDVAGLVGLTPADLHPRLGVQEALATEESERLLHLGLASDAGYVLCCPGAAFGAAKLWPPEHFARTLDALHEMHGWRAVITGGPGEEPLVRRVQSLCKHDALSLADEPRDLERLKPLVRSAQLVLVGDSGPRWYAAAFDVPCVTIMGPNFPELTATSLEVAEVVRLEGLECAPCLQRVCPLGHHRCMTELPPERALEAADRVLAAGATLNA